MDLGITTKNTFDKLIAAGEIPKNRKVSAPKAKAALYKEMNQNKPEGWAYCKTDSDKRSFCISSIKAKNGKEKLTRAEEDFIWSRPTSFRLYRKTPASKVWHELMVRAAKEQEDREGIAENHTRHCMCVECTEFAL